MNILLIGMESDLPFVFQTIHDKEAIQTTIHWSSMTPPDLFTYDFITGYDCILLAFRKIEMAEDIRLLIYEITGGHSITILNFYLLYHLNRPALKVDRAMLESSNTHAKCNGIILGISHAEVGIIPHFLEHQFCNLALSSQDLYYNIKAFEYCYSKYNEMLQKLEYIIFDLYDYTYFNFDTSLSKNIRLYYSWGGILDPHNYEKNKLFSCSFDELVQGIYDKKFKSITLDMLTLWGKLFPDIYINFPLLDTVPVLSPHLRTHKLTKETALNYDANTSIVRNIYQDTIQENIALFYQFLDRIYQINPKMKVYLTLLPRYYDAQQQANITFPQYNDWKNMFYTIIQEANKTYPFTFLDFKEHDISKKIHYYYDVSHFNYYGAIEFSKLLNTYLK